MVDFIKYRFVFFIVSFSLFTIGFFIILTRGFSYSIDFIGGGAIEFSTQQESSIRAARTLVTQQYPTITFQQVNTGFVLKGKDVDSTTQKSLTSLLSKFSDVQKARFERVGPSVGVDNIQKMLIASLFVIGGILIYITVSFKNWRFAVAAVVALLHDTLILISLWSVVGLLWGVEVDVLFITAVLTTMSFSVHDTVVIFDKVKEEFRKNTNKSLKDNINWALNITMMRSFNNSLTILIMLSSLIVLGGETVRWFAVALFIGTVLGTYSSPFIAAPAYYLLEKK